VGGQILQAFDCEEFQDGKSFLKADYSVSCAALKYKIMRWYAGISLLVFPVGIPALFLWLLFKDKDKLNP
ncbi:unnamed protein product, partial [Discosporangium mesarthrocarpum]